MVGSQANNRNPKPQIPRFELRVFRVMGSLGSAFGSCDEGAVILGSKVKGLGFRVRFRV